MGSEEVRQRRGPRRSKYELHDRPASDAREEAPPRGPQAWRRRSRAREAGATGAPCHGEEIVDGGG
ncbi:unnamed protein product, partial [Prorocentrum cordatum]